MELLHRGKVRDLYAVDADLLLILATDRLSAYDVIFPDPIPGKGVILTALTKWWLQRMGDVAPSHWIPDDVALRAACALPEWPDWMERTMIVQRCEVIPFECVVRGYAYGSYLNDYPEVAPMTPLDPPVFTPTTKAATGHDEAVTFDQMEAVLGETAHTLRTLSIDLFRWASTACLRAGIVLVDTKFEFGWSNDGQLRLIDECITPDSSRFMLQKDVRAGRFESFDKQVVRDYVDRLGWDRSAPAPKLPPAIIDQTRARYEWIYQQLKETPKEST